MTQQNTELEQFLLWFSEIEEVPLATRKDFFAHVLEVGGLDVKARAFIDATLADLKKRNEKKRALLQQKIDILDTALAIESKPQYSLKERLVIGFNDWINEKVSNFKSKFRAEEAQIAKAEESAEDMENAANIARLKASLAQ